MMLIAQSFHNGPFVYQSESRSCLQLKVVTSGPFVAHLDKDYLGMAAGKQKLTHPHPTSLQEAGNSCNHLSPFFFFFQLYFLTSASFSIKKLISKPRQDGFQGHQSTIFLGYYLLNSHYFFGPNSSSFHLLAYRVKKRMSLTR